MMEQGSKGRPIMVSDVLLCKVVEIESVYFVITYYKLSITKFKRPSDLLRYRKFSLEEMSKQ